MWARHEASRQSTVRSVQTSERLREAWMFVEVVVAAAFTTWSYLAKKVINTWTYFYKMFARPN
jgi:hypothetical protein